MVKKSKHEQLLNLRSAIAGFRSNISLQDAAEWADGLGSLETVKECSEEELLALATLVIKKASANILNIERKKRIEQGVRSTVEKEIRSLFTNFFLKKFVNARNKAEAVMFVHDPEDESVRVHVGMVKSDAGFEAFHPVWGPMGRRHPHDPDSFQTIRSSKKNNILNFFEEESK